MTLQSLYFRACRANHENHKRLHMLNVAYARSQRSLRVCTLWLGRQQLRYVLLLLPLSGYLSLSMLLRGSFYCMPLCHSAMQNDT